MVQWIIFFVIIKSDLNPSQNSFWIVLLVNLKNYGKNGKVGLFEF
jgi:hypothetical protein